VLVNKTQESSGGYGQVLRRSIGVVKSGGGADLGSLSVRGTLKIVGGSVDKEALARKFVGGVRRGAEPVRQRSGRGTETKGPRRLRQEKGKVAFQRR